MPSSPPPMLSPPVRRRRWRWLAALLVLALVTPAGYLFFQGERARHDLAAMMAELDASDPGWRLEEIERKRPDVPDEQNSAPLVRALARQLKTSGFFTALAANESLFWDLLPQSQLDGNQLQALRGMLGPLAPARAEALRLKDLPEGRHAIVFAPDFLTTQVVHAQNCREVAGYWEYDAMLRAEEEDLAGALQACRAALNTGRSLGEEPSPITQLVHLACQGVALATLERVLAQGEAPAAELEALAALLEREAHEPLLLYQARAGRAGGERVHEALAAGILTPAALAMLRVPGAPTGWWQKLREQVPLIQARSRAEHLRQTTRVVAAARLPVEQQLDAMAAIEAEAGQSLLLFGPKPGLTDVTKCYVRGQARLQTARLGVAAERYRLRHGRWPELAADLVQEGLLDAIPGDPYDGQPLRWRLLPDGAVAYSVGPDRTDNGGTLDRGATPGPNTDVGFRLWHPVARQR